MTESVAEFAERARAWLADNMPRIADPNNPPYADRGEEDSWQHVRQLQRRLYDGGFAGICFPSSTAGLAWTSRIRRRSTTKAPATSCR